MILSPQGTSSGINPQRHRHEYLGRRQTLGHNLFDGLVEWWPLNEQLGERRGVHANLQLSDNNTVTGAAGVGSAASLFTRVNTEYLSRASEAALQVGDIDFTIALWVLFTSLPGGVAMRVLSKRANGTTLAEYEIGFNGTSTLFFQFIDTLGNLRAANSTPTVTTGTWYFVVGWHDAAADTVNLQIDANAVDSAATSGGFPPTGSSNFYLGELQQVSRALDGRMQRVGFWKRALSAAERAHLYNSGRGRDYPFV